MTLSCPHFGVCGGCSELTVPHRAQRAAREAEVRQALGAHLGDLELRWTDAGDLPPRHDRLRILYPAAPQGDGAVSLGLYRRGSHQLVGIASCELQDPALTALGARAEAVFRGRRLQPYDETTHRGDLRAFSARLSASTGEVLIGVVATRADLPGAQGLARELRRAADGLQTAAGQPVEVAGVVLNVNPERGNALLGAATSVLDGRDHLVEESDGLRFRVGFASFYQLHRRASALLYAPALEMAGDLRGRTVIDGFGGVGTFALRCAARGAARVDLVEASPSAAADARHNATQVEGTIEVHEMPFAAAALPTPDLLIVDPNRAGLQITGRTHVLAMAPPRILYVACGLPALARDLAALPGYALREVRLADLFPHTGHVEVLALLEMQ